MLRNCAKKRNLRSLSVKSRHSTACSGLITLFWKLCFSKISVCFAQYICCINNCPMFVAIIKTMEGLFMFMSDL